MFDGAASRRGARTIRPWTTPGGCGACSNRCTPSPTSPRRPGTASDAAGLRGLLDGLRRPAGRAAGRGRARRSPRALPRLPPPPPRAGAARRLGPRRPRGRCLRRAARGRRRAAPAARGAARTTPGGRRGRRLAGEAADAADTEGRVLGAANQALPRPTSPSPPCGRPRRRCASTGATATSPCSSRAASARSPRTVLKAAAGELNGSTTRQARRFDDEAGPRARGSCASAGWLDDADRLTEAGRARHEEIEAPPTGRGAAWAALGRERTDRLAGPARPAGDRRRGRARVPARQPDRPPAPAKVVFRYLRYAVPGDNSQDGVPDELHARADPGPPRAGPPRPHLRRGGIRPAAAKYDAAEECPWEIVDRAAQEGFYSAAVLRRPHLRPHRALAAAVPRGDLLGLRGHRPHGRPPRPGALRAQPGRHPRAARPVGAGDVRRAGRHQARRPRRLRAPGRQRRRQPADPRPQGRRRVGPRRQKIWIGNGGIADVTIVNAVVDPELGTKGQAMFVVAQGHPGHGAGPAAATSSGTGRRTPPS